MGNGDVMLQRNSSIQSARIPRSLRKYFRAACVAAFMAASAATGMAQPKPAATPLRIYFIDTEGGQATLFVMPDHTSLLVDTGYPRPNARDANRIVRAAKLADVGRIDYMLFTHYHVDHLGDLADVVARIPIGTFIDHGPNREPDVPGTARDYATYQKLLQTGKYKHITAKPGDKLPIAGADITVVSGDGNVIDKPLPGAGKPNAACATPDAMPADIDLTKDVENGRSLGFEMNFGKIRILDLGDLWWDHERELMCPNNKLGHINLLVVSHHGTQPSSSPVLINGITPQVAIMDNGERKGGVIRVLDVIHNAPNKPDLWQLHYAIASGGHNTDASQIANLSSPAPNAVAAPDDAGYMITVEALPNGAFTVTNERTGQSKAYVAH